MWVLVDRSVDLLWTASSTVYEEFPVLSIFLLIFFVLEVSYNLCTPKNLPPGPWTIPWVGSPYKLTDNVHHDLNNLAKKHGDIFTLMMGKKPVIVLNSNRLIREALVKKGEEFATCPAMYDLDYTEMQNSIFSSSLFRKKTNVKSYMQINDELFNTGSSKKWKEQRAVMVQLLRAAGFGSNKVEDTFVSHLDTMYKHLEKKTPVSMCEPIQKVVAMTLADVVYSGGYSYNDPELLTLMALSIESMASAFREGTKRGYWTDKIPSKITEKIQPSMMNNMLTANSAFQRFLMKKIQDHRAVSDNDKPRDVIDGYLAEKGDDADISDLAFSSTILMLFPDGIGSASSLLQFILFYMAYHPEWQKKVQDQLDHVCSDNRPVLADRDKLPMVEATIHEVSRLASVVCLTMAHSPVKATTLEGYNIPQDSYILGNIWAAHMDKEIFPQGDSFAPETLIDGKGKFIRNDSMLMFTAGHRMCLGSQLVQNMAFLYLSTTLKHFTVSFPQGEPLPPLGSKGGLIREPLPHKICFTPRGKAAFGK